MHSLRRRLIALAFGVMASQLAGIATVSVALTAAPAAAPMADADDVACTCVHGANAECPMHKHKKPAPSSRQTRWCAGREDVQATLLTTLMGVAGPLERRQPRVSPGGPSESIATSAEHPLDLVRPPVLHPPRG